MLTNIVHHRFFQSAFFVIMCDFQIAIEKSNYQVGLAWCFCLYHLTLPYHIVAHVLTVYTSSVKEIWIHHFMIVSCFYGSDAWFVFTISPLCCVSLVVSLFSCVFAFSCMNLSSVYAARILAYLGYWQMECRWRKDILRFAKRTFLMSWTSNCLREWGFC